MDDDLLSYDYVPPHYKPVAAAIAAHNIPHFDQSLNTVDNHFDIMDGDQINQEYFMAAFSMPICIIVLGILSLIIYQLTLCFRFCCQCCCKTCNSFKPMLVVNEGDRSIFCWRITKNRPGLMFFFFFSLTCACVANFCMYIGRGYIDDAFFSGGDSLTLLSNVLQNIGDSTTGLINSANSMSNLLSAPQCAQYFGNNSDASSQVKGFNSSSSDIGNVVGSYPKKITHARDIFLSYQFKSDQVLLIYFAFIMLVILLHIILTCCRSKVFLNLLILFTELIVFTLTIVAGCEMMIVVLLGDFCIDPAQNAINVITGQSNASNVLSYYLKCEGQNEFVEPIRDAKNQLSDFNQTIFAAVQTARQKSSNSSLGTECLADFQRDISNVVQSINGIVDSIVCEPIYNVWSTGINDALCDSAMSGMFTIWLCHLLTAGFLYFVLIDITWFHDLYRSEAIIAAAPMEADAENVDTNVKAEVEMADFGGDNHNDHRNKHNHHQQQQQVPVADEVYDNEAAIGNGNDGGDSQEGYAD